MALYFLTYDLRNKRNYQKLYDELNEFKAVQILGSTWCFNRINTSPKMLREYFKQFIGNDDGLLIDESINWATMNTNGTPNDL